MSHSLRWSDCSKCLKLSPVVYGPISINSGQLKASQLARYLDSSQAVAYVSLVSNFRGKNMEDWRRCDKGSIPRLLASGIITDWYLSLVFLQKPRTTTLPLPISNLSRTTAFVKSQSDKKTLCGPFRWAPNLAILIPS
ncbi:uncharacterized protein ARMOST_13290 [Armillaria ostoyae]|uniref:Uncharacterized protein n=1 Tax=Armillaria ostoyae TaxID=47428 RepID=A0A284RMC3_ARMOS|nr:uncharacterized protein ARMOST_13290 [Armillaria ostoyae]